MRLVDELNDLHATYVRAINDAVAHDDFTLADQLAQAYDDEAVHLIAVREGRTHLLPLRRRQVTETPLRRMVKRLRLSRAA